MDKTKRYYYLDFLRAIATIGFIAIHVLSYNLNNPLNNFVWNFLQFVVIVFVMISGYVLSARYYDKIEITSFFKKRLLRLLPAFYIYLICHYAVSILMPTYFSGIGLEKSLSFILNSILFTGGVMLNWLPLLFIELYLIFPFFMKYFKSKSIIIPYIAAALAVTIIFTFITFSRDYFRFVMWLPWSLIFLLGIYMERLESQKKNSLTKLYLVIIIINFIMFISFYIFFLSSHRSLNFVDNKYPPNLYYLAYGTTVSLIFYIVVKHISPLIEKIKWSYVYISRKSYPLFFLHFILLDLVLRFSGGHWGVFVEFIIVLFGSLGILYLGDIIQNYILS